MLKINFIGTRREIVATEGYVVRISDAAPQKHDAAKRLFMLPDETEEDYTEVMTLPEYSETDYSEEVVSRIRLRYSGDEESAILRKALALNLPVTIDGDTEAPDADKVLQEFSEYNAYAERCKAEAREYLKSRPPVPEPPVFPEPEEPSPEAGEEVDDGREI